MTSRTIVAVVQVGNKTWTSGGEDDDAVRSYVVNMSPYIHQRTRSARSVLTVTNHIHRRIILQAQVSPRWPSQLEQVQ